MVYTFVLQLEMGPLFLSEKPAGDGTVSPLRLDVLQANASRPHFGKEIVPSFT